MKYQIELEEEELHLISRALDSYCRVGLLQFDYLTDNYGLQKLIDKKDIRDEFQNKADELKSIFGYAPNANPGIYNKEDVSDDARIAFHLHQIIRHEQWNNRETKSSITVDACPADACKIARIPIPKFTIKTIE